MRQQLPLTNCPEGANGAKAVMPVGLARGSEACVADAGQNGGHGRAVCQANATAWCVLAGAVLRRCHWLETRKVQNRAKAVMLGAWPWARSALLRARRTA